MDVKELKELLGSDEGKKIFSEIAQELGYESPEAVQGLRTKRDELLGSLKKTKDELNEIKSKVADVDIDEYHILKEKGSGNKAADEVVTLKRQLNVLESKYKEEASLRSKIEQSFDNKLKEAELNKIFNEIGIDQKHAKLLTSAFKDKVKTEGDYDKREIIVDADGTGLGLPAAEYFKKWAVSDEGKPYLREPESRGTGSQQFAAKNAKVISRQDFDALPVEERTTLVNSGVKVE